MDSRRRLTICITISFILVMAGGVEATPFAPSGKGGQVSGKATVSVRKLGRDRSTLTSELRIGPSALSADAPGGFRVAGPYAQSGSGGRTLAVTHDPGSESSLLSFLAGRVAALYARRRNDQASFGVTVLSRRTQARANRKGTKIKLTDVVRFTATSPEIGQSFRGKYSAKQRGTLVDTPLPACAAADDPIALELNALGVSTCPSPRIDDEGDDLPDGYTPLGPTTSFDTKEILFAGLDATFPAPGGTSDTVAIFELTPDTPAPGDPVTSYTPVPLYSPTGADIAWTADAGSTPQTLRAAAALNLDSDGLEEVVAVFMVGSNLTVRIIDDGAAGFGATEAVVATQAGVRDVAAVAGNFDGDGLGELAVALALDDQVRLLLFSFDGTSFRLDDTRTVAQLEAGSVLFTSLDTGNIDNDPADELVIVVNERLGAGNIPSGGVAQYLIWDDKSAGFVELASGLVRTEVGTTVRTAVVADASLGDVDGDGRREVVFGALTNYAAVTSGNACLETGHLLLVLDDAKHGFAELGKTFFNYVIPGCNGLSADVWMLHYIHVTTPDLDGDGATEIQANHFFYDDFLNAAPFTALPGIPVARLFDGNDTLLFDRSTSAASKGDVNGDGREDVVFFFQSLVPRISVWGDDELTGFGEVTRSGGGLPIPTQFENFQNPSSPILLPVNAAADGPVLEYSEGEYRFVLTQPIIIAALASPPCWTGVGQVTDACRTSYGTSQTTTGGVDGSVRVFAKATVGGKAEVFGQGVELKASITRALSFSAARSYALEQSIVFTTGPLEDAVVFTSVPVDQYTYTITSHPVPSLVGEQVVVSLPRTPITLIAERSFYNRTVSAGSFLVDGAVFAHTIGNPRSYPSRSQKNTLIEPRSETGAALLDLLEQLGLDTTIVGALLGGGFDSQLATVGQGGGETTAAVSFSETNEYRAGAEVSFELEAETTAGGVLVGGSVGGSVDAGISWGSSSATAYSGTVGSLPAASFAENQYSFGLFTYLFNAGEKAKPQFEVVHYWVE